jgi:1,4-dihydroxy-2-naphthoate polyprenyltransferase
MSSTFSLWSLGMRPYSVAASVIPLCLGALLAYEQVWNGLFSPAIFLCTLVAGLLLHATTNLTETYFDCKGSANTNDVFTWTKWESGEKGLLRCLLLCLLLLTPVAFYLVLRVGLGALVFGLIALVGIWLYAAPPFQLRRGPFGNLMVFLFFGVLLSCGSYYAQIVSHAIDAYQLPNKTIYRFMNVRTDFNLWRLLRGIHTFPLFALSHAFPLACLIAATAHAANHRDIQTDANCGIKTYAVVLGEERSRRYYYFYLVVAYLYPVVWGIVYKIVDWSTDSYMPFPLAERVWLEMHFLFLLPLLSFPLVIPALRKIRQPIGNPELNDMDVVTGRIYVVYGILFLLGIWWGFRIEYILIDW